MNCDFIVDFVIFGKVQFQFIKIGQIQLFHHLVIDNGCLIVSGF